MELGQLRGSGTMSGCPERLNIGSGRAFDETAVNIDIQPTAGPDIVADMSRRDLVGLTFETRRFGPVELAAGRFEHITASHVLEHVPDLVGLMTNCLTLLQDGGRMSIRVPYDLSHGAWQDPTHLRAFNERSWLYYTTWHWQVGWEEDRFEIVDQQLVLGPEGSALRKEGMKAEEIRQRPRMVMEISVELRKRRITDKERATAQVLARGHLERFPELAVPVTRPPVRRVPPGAARYLDLLAAGAAEFAPGRDLATLASLGGATFDDGLSGDFLAVGQLADGAILAGVRASRSAPGCTWIAVPDADAEGARRALERLRLDDGAVRLLAGPAAGNLAFAPFAQLSLMVLDGDGAAVGPLLPLVFDRLLPGGTILVAPAGAAALTDFLARRQAPGDPPGPADDWISWRRPMQPA